MSPLNLKNSQPGSSCVSDILVVKANGRRTTARVSKIIDCSVVCVFFVSKVSCEISCVYLFRWASDFDVNAESRN